MSSRPRRRTRQASLPSFRRFGQPALARLGGWDLVDRVVTDDGLAPKWRDAVREVGAELSVAPVDEPALGDGR